MVFDPVLLIPFSYMEKEAQQGGVTDVLPYTLCYKDN